MCRNCEDMICTNRCVPVEQPVQPSDETVIFLQKSKDDSTD